MKNVNSKPLQTRRDSPTGVPEKFQPGRERNRAGLGKGNKCLRQFVENPYRAVKPVKPEPQGAGGDSISFQPSLQWSRFFQSGKRWKAGPSHLPGLSLPSMGPLFQSGKLLPTRSGRGRQAETVLYQSQLPPACQLSLHHSGFNGAAFSKAGNPSVRRGATQAGLT